MLAYLKEEGQPMSSTITVQVRVPDNIGTRYDRLAKQTGRARSYYVNEALAAEIDRLEYEYGIMKQVEDYRAGRLNTYSLDEVEQSLGLGN